MTSAATALRNEVRARVVSEPTAFPELDGWELEVGPLTRSQVLNASQIKKVITFIDSGGRASHPTLLLDYPTVQVCQRGAVVYDTEPLRAVKDIVLGRVPGYTKDYQGAEDQSLWIAAVNMNTDISFLYEDENGRKEFVMNLALITEPRPAGDRTEPQREPLPGAI